MLFPKKVKYRKWHTMRENPKKVGPATRGIKVSFGSHGLKAITPGRINSRQIESARKAITRNLGKTGRVWIRIFPDMPYTKKPAEVKMGKGKGDIEGYCARVLAGQVMFEVDGALAPVAIESLRKGGTKMPVKTKIVARI
ncbi:MAG: 50S ribosomal protein L16 [Candidatus Zambryskibacteria bacterium RIFCSPLOWO2_01_FULL_39_39]|uniref:Large ribosomal subunit protein uL16 n=1 Tax=Candidatus Zambryskibacteria bacterium RIFCSPLOWO2_01_FULL_39_39 TaxID=1802758 RepID=A0A1G2TXV5_9BACT|nr:MAG: 50S ribosomal protein L16 [Parcubacteria group bacterium GW2011_GWA1_38_7]OHA87131.1 MAG: 50S ribosomal protein L16 [Candidatus Zambryskibacteria bacterium RIFCSPHIGHO2_01_FULL_39_63]OHA94672.1 MAG: 50S ribosomal protein L16 [Candidatus Zambryskibacteria bacterium RIFCSPHIGHO2_02_FULL_39_19]OHA98123.1 MAG: 50S ribosomal protein L16 [Candidatus Zambryskibacteria bacterium RIFCSPHIGHO2_12_FULL_39_21]OHB02135.1 MAG: 50S ribosomal protein L16 [Candidatus Zambryskibacteria bacterium RIFCSPLO